LSFLNGREVIQVAIGAFQTQFAFYRGSCDVDGTRFRLPSPFNCAVKVFEPAFNINGDVTLGLSNGHSLTIPDSSKECESYQITKPGLTIVV